MHYRVLGPFEVLDGDEPVHLGGGRQRAFLALLLLNANHVVSTDRIIDQLWGDEAPDTVANVIQVYVSRLRKALEPDRPKGAPSSVLLTRRPGYVLTVDPDQIDAVRFEELSRQGREALVDGAMGIAASLLNRALHLWSGDVLADLAFEDFARTEIERLTEARLVCMEGLHEAQLALGQHEELVGVLETLVDTHPLREQLWAQLMLALYRSGRQAEALRAYRRAADILVEELGIDPSPRLQELEELVLMQDASLDAPSVRREPLPVTTAQLPPPLIGRVSHMAAVDDGFAALENGRSVLITVTGSPGMGVRRLLDEIDRTGRARGFDISDARAFPTTPTHAGEIIGQLGGLEGRGPAVATVAHAEFCDPTSLAALRSALVAGDRPVLVALGLTPQDERRGQGIARLTEEVRSVATVIPLEVHRYTQSQCEQVMDPDLAEEMMRLTGGLPIEVAQVLSSLREQGAVEWNDSRITTLGELPETVVPSLTQRVLDLPKDRRRLVEACALAGVPMPLEVVVRILRCDGDEALDAVEALVAEGLLDESPEGVRVSSAIGSDRIADRFGETRRTAVYRELASSFDGVADDRTIGWYALHSQDNRRAADLLAAAGLAEVERGNLGEGQELLEGARTAKERLGETGDGEWGMLHLGLAQCHRLAGWSDRAAEALSVAIPLLDGAALVDALGWAAQVADDRQKVPESEWWVARAEHAAVLDSAPEKLGSLLSLRARVLNRLGFAAESDMASAKSQALLARHAGPRQVFLSSYNRAWVLFDRGEVREAESAFATLLDAAQSDGQQADLAAWHGRALFAMGRAGEALETLDRAENLGRKTGDGGPVFLATLGRAEGALSFGMMEEAEAAVAEFIGLVLHQFPSWENIARYLAARLAWAQGDMETASDEVANAVELSDLGAGSRRWWLPCRALQMRIDEYDGEELDALIDEAQKARWHAAELPLLGWAALARRRVDLADQAALLGIDHGLVVQAARAFGPVGDWGSDIGRRLAAMVRSNTQRGPASWVAAAETHLS